MKYSEQLQQPEWKKKRIEILKRDKRKCTVCGAQKLLQVHHKKYISGKMAWEVPNEYLVTLCKKHHEEAHYGKPVEAFIKGRKRESAQELAFRMAMQAEVNKNNRRGAEFQKVKRKDVERIVRKLEIVAIKEVKVKIWLDSLKEEYLLKPEHKGIPIFKK